MSEFTPTPAPETPDASPEANEARRIADVPHFGKVALDAVAGNRPPTWRERAEASTRATSSGRTFSEAGPIGEVGYQEGYNVDKIPVAMSLDPDNPATVYKKVSELDEAERRMYGIPEGAGETVRFSELRPETKQMLFDDRLASIEAASRNKETREAAMAKNIDRMKRGIVADKGDYLHGLLATDLGDILNTGLVCGEGIGIRDGRLPETDVYPFNLDVWDGVSAGVIPGNGRLEVPSFNYISKPGEQQPDERINAYGNVLAVLDRSEGNTDVGNEVDRQDRVDGQGVAHKLIFGGVPVTEIRALQMLPPRISEFATEHERQLVEQLNAAAIRGMKRDMVIEGMFIPIYDSNGDIVFDYDEYREAREAKARGVIVYAEPEEVEPTPSKPPVGPSDGLLIL